MKHEPLTPTQVTLRELPKGAFFTLRDYGEYPDGDRVYVKGDYDRSDHKYTCHKYYDMMHESYIKPDRKVWSGFTF